MIQKALTFSYDDGVEQDRKLLEIFNKFGLKGTFNLNSGIQKHDKPWYYKDIVPVYRMNSEGLDTLYKGHEIAVHGLNHINLKDADRIKTETEIFEDKKNLEKLFQTDICGMAYAFGAYTDESVEVIHNAGLKYARTTAVTHSFDLEQDMLRYNATCHHADEKLFELGEQFLRLTPDKPQIFYVWGHSYEFDQNTEDNNWDLIERFAEFVSGKEDVWYATNIEIYDYVTAFRSLEISLSEKIIHNPTAHTIFFEYETEKHQINPGATVCFA